MEARKARVNTVTGEVSTIGHGRNADDGTDFITYEGTIPAHDRIEDLDYNGSEIVNDPTNPRAVALDNAKADRNAARARLRADLADPNLRGGMPALAEKVKDIVEALITLGALTDE